MKKMSDNQNIVDHYLLKENKYKQLFGNYRELFKILFSVADMNIYLNNADSLQDIIDKNIELENDLGL